MKVALAMILGALVGFVAAASTWADLGQPTSDDDARAVVIVRAAWQDLRRRSERPR